MNDRHIEVDIDIEALAVVADGVDKLVAQLKSGEITTPELVNSLVNKFDWIKPEKSCSLLALMTATALQRLAAQ